MKTTPEYISVNAKYSFNDPDPAKRRIAELLRDGIDLGLFTPELGIFNVTGKKVLDLALDRLARDMEAAKAGLVKRQGAQAEAPIESSEKTLPKRPKSTSDLSKLMAQDS